jgi:transketolase N-terminal domain/subunit/pyruvate/2-oxoglutarate/acetoin dehydrogenase E1 component
MKYVEYLNSLIKEEVINKNQLIIFGQNIDAGSSLSGLTRDLSIKNNGLIINSQNSENTLVGSGFGLMLNNVSSIFFMKQMDFLLLGVDHLVNTYNIIRQSKPSASFTIFPVIVDSGFEGPQSALNNFDDYCSIAGVEGYSISNKVDSKEIISEYLVKPGFRIISPGQRALRNELLDLSIVQKDSKCNYFQYEKGSDVSIVCFNQALPYGVKLNEYLLKKSISASLFSVNNHLNSNFDFLLDDIGSTKRLIIIDDSKSRNRMSNEFLIQAQANCTLINFKIISCQFGSDSLYPRADILEIDYTKFINEFFRDNLSFLVREKTDSANVINVEIRKNIIRMVSRGGAAHIGSALSSVEILNAIFSSVDINKIKHNENDRDRIIFSKGHGTAALYAVMCNYGLMPKELLDEYFKNGSVLAGHTSHFIDNIEHSTGALGHGLSVGTGIAIGCLSKGYDNRIYVVVGDGELNEGSNWEAIMYAGHLKLSNLCLIVDKNRFAQMSDVAMACTLDPLIDKFKAFNFKTFELQDGHDESKLINIIEETKKSIKPVVIICNTTKGKGISFMENDNLWHYKTPTDKQLDRAIKELDSIIEK